jgi:hypothetical protein
MISANMYPPAHDSIIPWTRKYGQPNLLARVILSRISLGICSQIILPLRKEQGFSVSIR